MRSTGIRIFSFGLLCTMILTAGCTKGSMEYRPDSDGKVTVTLNFTAEGPLRAARGAASGTHAPAVISLTRAVATPSSTDETAGRDMWVLQYDMASPQGELRTKELVSEIYQEGEKVYVRAELEPMASSRIVVIANDPGSISDGTPAIGSTLSELNAMNFEVASATGTGIPRDGSGVLPMRGESADMTLEAGTPATVRLPLYRLVSKVRFTLDNRCADTYPRLTVTSVALRKVPAVGSYTRIVEPTHSSVRFPAADPDNFMNYGPVTEGVNTAHGEYLWYMAPNSRGTGTATKPSDKTIMTAPDGQGSYCSYISVQGVMEKLSGGEQLPMSYRIYLGGNSTDDYNIWANEAYTVRMTVNTLPDNPEVDMGHDGFEIEISGPGGNHDNTVEDWDNPSFDIGPGIDVEDTDGTHDNTVEGWGNN